MGDGVTLAEPVGLEGFAGRARHYADQARAASTRRAYASDGRAFARWCEARGECALPARPAAVLAYLIEAAETLRVTTLQRRLAGLRMQHAASGFELDTASAAFRDTWRGIRRVHGRPAARKRPLLTVDLRRAVATLPESLSGLRDRALILVGFAAALRRSELAGLAVAPGEGAGWIEEQADGLAIHLGRSKTDQRGEGVTLGIPYGSQRETCPVRSYRAWIQAAGLSEGPAFRPIDRHGRIGAGPVADRTVARIVQRTVEAAFRTDGHAPEEARRRATAFAGHSLRAGLATSAAAHDAPGHAIQRQLRHKRFDTTSGYIRAGQLFRQNPAGMVGL